MFKRHFIFSGVLLTSSLMSTAQATENQKMSYEEIKAQVIKLGLNKKLTAQDFLTKMKTLQPDYKNAELENFVQNNPSALMPVLEMKPVQTPNGEVVVMNFNENGKLYTVQYYGENEKYLKVNNTVLSENEAADTETLSRTIAGEAQPKK